MGQTQDSSRLRDPWGSITKQGGKWRVRYTDNAGNRRSSGTFDTYQLAWWERVRLGALYQEGKLMPEDIEGQAGLDEAMKTPIAAVTTVRAWVSEKRPARKKALGAGSFVNEQSILERYIVPDLGSIALADLTSKVINDYWEALEDKTGPVHRRNIYCTLSAHLRLAVEEGLLPANPAKVEHAWRLTSPKRPRRTTDEAREVIAELPEDLRVLALLSADVHLRPGEARGLNRGDYDLKTGWLKIQRKDTYYGGRKLEAPKRDSVGKVKVSAGMRRLLEAHLAALRPGTGDDPMFPGIRGARVSVGRVTEQWTRAREAVGDPSWHIHDLRGVGLTALEERGVSWKDLKRRSRHKTDGALAAYLHTDERRDAEVTEQWDWLPEDSDDDVAAKS